MVGIFCTKHYSWSFNKLWIFYATLVEQTEEYSALTQDSKKEEGFKKDQSKAIESTLEDYFF